MSSEVINAFVLCRGKVGLYKQQLLNRFSNDHTPVQYGLDYSSKIKPLSPKSECKTNKPKPVLSVTTIIRKPLEKSPEIKQRLDIKSETYETVKKIELQKSPVANRKVVLISSRSNVSQTKPNDNLIVISSANIKDNKHDDVILIRPVNLQISDKISDEDNPNFIGGLNSPLDRNTRVKEYIGNQILSPISEPEVVTLRYKDIEQDNRKRIVPMNKLSTDRYCTQPMKTEIVDPTLVSVAQRAKSLMSNKPGQSNVRSNSITPADLQPEGNDESLLSIKDRIKLFKGSINQSVAGSSSMERPQKRTSNRFKTQPLSFDDIARANAMILDQSEVSSIIASPSITNSIETLVDFSESSNSSSNKTSDSQNSSVKLRKSTTVLRAQSSLFNQNPTVYKSIDEEELISSIKVKDFIKNCDVKENEIIPLKLSKNSVVSRKLAFKSKTEKDEKFNKPSKVYSKSTHLTQPITKIDFENTEMYNEENNQSIKDRISQMQSDGSNWKTRIHKDLDIDPKARPSSVVISNLQEQLQVKHDQWKDRVEPKDVEEFTTISRLQRSFRQNNNTKRYTIHGQLVKANDMNCNHLVVRLDKNNVSNDLFPPKKTLISDIIDSEQRSTNNDVVKYDIKTDSTIQDAFKSQIIPIVQSQKVTVPHISDQSLSNFFHSSSSSPDQPNSGSQLHTNDDFDDIFLQSDLNININKRSVKPTRKQKPSSRNPLKKLNERLDIKNEYDETITGVAEHELRRLQTANIQANAGFAEEALAGLTSKEDFSKIKLKRTESSKSFEHFVSPYKDLMLISVKGRKNVQVRLVEPIASSINLGDCYLLLTKQNVFVWIGECANVIETNKANELGSWIAKCKELNYSGNIDKPTVVHSNDNENNANFLSFWKCLHYDSVQKINPPGDVSEDEIYEQIIQRTNMVYKVVGNQLIPFNEYWGYPLKHKMLVDDEVFVFDFGTELYLWSGSKASMKDKSHGRNFLKMLFSEGYNYEECSINPLDPLPNNREETKLKKGTPRPNWVIVGRLPQKGETTLFKEKFSDWPEISRLIKTSNNIPANIERNKSLESDLQPVDFGNLLTTLHPSVHITIDGKSVGRGGKWKVIEDGILREFSVITKNISMWQINDNDAIVVDPKKMGQFCSGDAYIIRWDYELTTHGRYMRNNRSGNLSSAFFFWQGVSTSITEKTASALLTIDLDKEHATQIRVKQHHESPAFCRLFDGSMVVYIGKQRSLCKAIPDIRLFIIRGEIESEAHLVEVSCLSQSLRSRSVFLLINISKKKAFIWFGNLASEESKNCMNYCIKRLTAKKPVDLGISLQDIKIEETYEAKEPRTFWECMGIIKKWKSSFESKILEPIRGWIVSAVTGSFALTEIIYSLYPDHEHKITPAFPLLQSTLYRPSQPALALIWTPSHVYIWEGWWLPATTSSISSDCDINIDDDSDSNAQHLPLPKHRIASEKLALLKSLDPWLKQNDKNIDATIVYAGLEPVHFQELFPFWEVNEEAKNINKKRGHTLYQEDSVTEVLHTYLTMKYSVERLREQPLPENVIPSRIESYLRDEDFQDLFNMTKESFYDLSPWKQYDKKKEVNLF